VPTIKNLRHDEVLIQVRDRPGIEGVARLDPGAADTAMAIDTMTHEFERLEHTVGMIKRHPDYPGKELVLDECLEDIDERYRRGRLTAEQRGRLRHVLLEGVGH
jgi:hypothetical protein